MNEAFNKLTKSQQLYVESIRKIGGEWGYDLTKSNWTRSELVAVSMKRQSNDDVPNWIVKDMSRRVSRGVYSIPEIVVALDVSPGHEVEGDGLADTIGVGDDLDSSIWVEDDSHPIRGADVPSDELHAPSSEPLGAESTPDWKTNRVL
jgi:hypothetical protein